MKTVRFGVCSGWFVADNGDTEAREHRQTGNAA